MATDALGLTVVAGKEYCIVGKASASIGTDRVTMLLGDRGDQKAVVQCSQIFNRIDFLAQILVAGNGVWAQLAHAHLNGDLPQLKWKCVRFRTTANVNLAGGGLAAGTTHDGHTAAAGELAFVAAQSSAGENGIYLVPVSGAASRVPDYDQSDDIRSSVIVVERGTTYKRTFWVNTNDAAITVGSTALTFASLLAALGGSESGHAHDAVEISVDRTFSGSLAGWEGEGLQSLLEYIDANFAGG